jgi:hypothetical protein
MIKNKKIAVIGAGISGITLAKELSTLNDVIVFDKSRGVGGRMATRRVGNYNFDHGAQFFTAKSNEFKDFCLKAKNDDIIEEWKCRFVEIASNNMSIKPYFSNEPYFVAKPQMNSLCKYIGKDLNILLSKQIESVDFSNNKWSLKTSESEVFENFDYLFLAIPSNQATNLVPKNFKYFDIISNIKMSGCFTLMLSFKKDLKLDFDVALVKESIISWISLNNSKPARPHSCCVVVNSSNKWANENIEKDLESIQQKMMVSLAKIINLDLNNIDYQNIHRWRYANADSCKGKSSLFDSSLNLGICGDWMISGKVESAFLSGLDLYKNISN